MAKPNKNMKPKRVEFGKKYVVQSQIDFVKTRFECLMWEKIIRKTEDRAVWEAYIPKDHSIMPGTVVTFTDWALDGKDGTCFHWESELHPEDFVQFLIEGSDVVYHTNLKDVDKLEPVE